MSVHGGQSQTGDLAALLPAPLEVRVVDADGVPLAGVTVEWSVVSGGGSVSASSSATGDDGVARTLWTLGTRLDVMQRAQSRVAELPALEWRATAEIPETARLSRDGGNAQRAIAGTPLAAPLVARLTLENGQPIAGAEVTWTADVGGSIERLRDATDDDGRVAATAQLGPVAGLQRITASVTGGPSITFEAVASAGSPARLELLDGGSQRASAGTVLARPIRIRVLDALGNVVPNAEVQWLVVTGGGTVSASDRSDELGTASAAWTLGPVEGEQMLAVRVAGAAELRVPALAGPGSANVTLVAERIIDRSLSSGLTHVDAPRGDARLFLVESRGYILLLENGVVRPTPVLDITDRVRFGGEQGLLSMAFHPAYASNGHFFVNYTDVNGHTVIERYTLPAGASVAQRSSARRILFIEQPFDNHNGGQLAFGPDGMLYIGMGDGGAGNDPLNAGQDPSTLLGKMLRIDVDAGDPYAVPASNPFVGRAGYRPEIWALGLRNPWRFSIDVASGAVFIADVGQGGWEEVNAAPWNAAGLNYGWRLMEGSSCYIPRPCDPTGLTLPVVAYDHTQGCSIIGGYVYRGARIPELVGHYVYADHCRQWIRSFRLENGVAVDHREWTMGDVGNFMSFGVGGDGELYFTTSKLHLYRVTRAP